MKKYIKNLLISFVVVGSCMTMVVGDAEARRMGNAGSFGRQSPNAARQAPQQSPAGNASQPKSGSAAPAAAGATTSPWKGMLGGALLGLGAGALLSHFGMGGAMGGMLGSILMFGLLAMVGFFIFRMIRNRGAVQQPAYAGGYVDAGRANNTPEIGSRSEPMGFQNQTANAQAVGGMGFTPAAFGVPSDFDTQGFLRNAKTYFIRLQAAWDKADSNDIREFTSPEMYAEMKMQLQERGAVPNHTDVISLNAELLGVETVGSDYLASVKFVGVIKEAVDAIAEPFTEIWNLSKPTAGQGAWVLAGIQQVA